MKDLVFLLILFLFACSTEPKKDPPTEEDISISNKQEVEYVIRSFFDFSNNEDLSDSLTYNRFKAFFHDDFVLLPDHGEPLSDKETIWEGYRTFNKTNKGHFDVTIDRLDASDSLAYILAHYHESFTKRETGEVAFEVNHSAIFVLKKKDANNEWKIVVWRWT